MHPLSTGQKKTKQKKMGTLPNFHENRGASPTAVDTTNDITECKQVEAALAESERRYRGIVETALEGIALYEPDGTVTYVNQRMADLLGYSREKIIGMSTLDFVEAEEREAVIAAGESAKERGSFSKVWKLRRKDTSILWTLVNVTARRDAAGNVLGYLAMHTDITTRKQAEDALRQREREFAAMFEQSVVGKAQSDLDTSRMLRVNKAFADMLGYTPEEMTGMTFIEITHPDDREGNLEAYAPLRTGEDNRMEIDKRFFRKDGSVVWAHVAANLIRSDDGTPAYSIAVIQDITRRKHAEEALRKSEERSRSIVENSSEVLYRVDLRTGRYEYISKSAERLLGYPVEEFLAMTGEDTLALVHPDDLPGIREGLRWLEAEGSAQVEYRHRVRSGGYRWFSTNLTLTRDADGTPRYRNGYSRDITDRKWAEEALRESEARFRLMFESHKAVMLLIEPDTGKILDANVAAAEFYRYSRDRLRSMYIYQINQMPAEEVDAERRKAVDLERNRFIFPHRIANSERRWVEVHSSPVTLQNRPVLFSIIHDVTARLQAEEALQKAKQELEQRVKERTAELASRAEQLRALAGELTLSEQRERTRLARVLHDHLQQLLVASKFRIAILGRGGDELLKQGVKEIEDLIDESIAASRSLTVELSPPILHEAGLTAGLEWLARRMKDTHGLFVELELEESGVLPEAPKILLFESVRELLFNVVKHASVLSARVNLRRFDNSLRVVVSDKGKGFDPVSLPAAGESGRGFGLFGIRERLELMGGSFTIESILGQGSQFIVSMPVSPSESIQTPPQQVIPLPEAQIFSPVYPDPGRKIRVMLADDHAVVRQGMANLLGDEPDLEVVGQAADGQEAVDLASRLLPDVILMDMSMPKLNGVEATRLICNDWPEIRIVGLSMFEEADRAQAMRDAGAVDYLTKSGPADKLLSAIRKCIWDRH